MSSSITISLTRHREPDWLVRDALVSLAAQRSVAGRVLFVDQARDFARTGRPHESSAASFSRLLSRPSGRPGAAQT